MLEQQVNCFAGHVDDVAQTLYGAMDVSMPNVCLGDPLVIFFAPPNFDGPKEMFWSGNFFMQKTTKEDFEKVFNNPDQYQHKRYKQSATCHIFYICKIPSK